MKTKHHRRFNARCVDIGSNRMSQKIVSQVESEKGKEIIFRVIQEDWYRLFSQSPSHVHRRLAARLTIYSVLEELGT